MFLILGLGVIAMAQNTVPVTKDAAATPAADGPVLYMDTYTVDFGEIEQGSDPFRKVLLKNVGKAPLIIKNATGSCGCTVPTWPQNPIMPGASDTLTVRYDTQRPGAISKVVSLYTNQNEAPVTVKVQGKVNPKAVEPAGLPEKKSTIFNNKGSN